MAKILIVDDQRSVLLTLEVLLKSRDHSVVPCTNAMDALHALTSEPFDLVVTDAIMPGGSDGYALTQTIRHHPVLGKIPVVLLTGKREKSDIQKGIDVGVSDYVVKPLDPELFLAKIEKLLAVNPKEISNFAEASVGMAAEWDTGTVVQRVSELGLQLQSHIPLPVGKIVSLRSDLFIEIGITAPPMRIDSCVEAPGGDGRYHIEAHFVGVTEKELAPIRLWIRARKSHK